MGWRESVPQLALDADEQTCRLYDSAGIVTLPAGTTVFMQGDACKNYLIVLKGIVKVFTRAENGREIVLYRLADGDSCILTTSCLFGNRNYPAEGKTETEVTAMAIPVNEFNQALKDSGIFRAQVFSAFSSHITDLITLVEEVAFGKLDIRLAKFLISHCDANDTLRATHQDIATELGTAREVVSRQLKEMEMDGKIELGRGQVKILEKAWLASQSDS